MFHLSVQKLFEIFSAPIEIWQVALGMRADTRVGLHVTCQLFLSSTREKVFLNIKLHENSFCGSPFTDGRT